MDPKQSYVPLLRSLTGSEMPQLRRRNWSARRLVAPWKIRAFSRMSFPRMTTCPITADIDPFPGLNVYTNAVIVRSARSLTGRTTPVNTFSNVDLPVPSSVLSRRPLDRTKKRDAGKLAAIRVAQQRRRDWEQTDGGRRRMLSFYDLADTTPLAQYERMGVLKTLSEVADVGLASSNYGAPRSQRGVTVEFFEGERRMQRTPNPNVVPMRRWEDLSVDERRGAIMLVSQFGGTMRSMMRAYAAQLDQAHMTAFVAGASRPWSADFYSDESEPGQLLRLTSDRMAQHSGWPRDLDARTVMAAIHAVTSPGTKFRTGKPGAYRYPNSEVAEAVVIHVLNGGTVENAPTAKELRVGVFDHQVRSAVRAAMQLIHERRKLSQLTQESNIPYFSSHAPKVTAYVGAWVEPNGPDAYFVTDIHAAHGMLPHLDTSRTHAVTPSGDGRSEASHFVESGTAAVHALIDYLARCVHADRGLSPSVLNARYIPAGQATQWGREQEDRPDLTQVTTALMYPGLSEEQLAALEKTPVWTL